MQREEPVGARLREPGMEGRPRAAGLNLLVSPAVSLVTGESAGVLRPNSGGTTEKYFRPEAKRLQGGFCWGKGIKGLD